MRKKQFLIFLAGSLFFSFQGKAFSEEACLQVFNQKKDAMDAQTKQQKRAVKEKFAQKRQNIKKAKKKSQQDYRKRVKALVEAKAKAGKSLERAEWNCQPLFDAWDAKMDQVRSAIEIAKITAQSKDSSRFEKADKEVKKLMAEANQIKKQWQDCQKESKAARQRVKSLKKDLQKAQEKIDSFGQKLQALKKQEQNELQKIEQKRQEQLKILQLEYEKCLAIVKGKLTFEYEHIDEELKKYRKDKAVDDRLCLDCAQWQQVLKALKKEWKAKMKKAQKMKKRAAALKKKIETVRKKEITAMQQLRIQSGMIEVNKKMLESWKKKREEESKKPNNAAAMIVYYNYETKLNKTITDHANKAIKLSNEITKLVKQWLSLQASFDILSKEIEQQDLQLKQLKEKISRVQEQLKLCRYKNSCHRRVEKRKRKKQKKVVVNEKKATRISTEGGKTGSQKKKKEEKKETGKRSTTHKAISKKKVSQKPIAYLLMPQIPKELKKDFKVLSKAKRQTQEIDDCFAIALKYGIAKQKVKEIEKAWQKAHKKATEISYEVSMWEKNLKTLKVELDEAEREKGKATDAFFAHLSSSKQSVRTKYMKEMHLQEDAYQGAFDSYWGLKDKIKARKIDRDNALDREKELFRKRLEANKTFDSLSKAYEDCQKKVKDAALKEKNKFHIQKAIDSAQNGDTVTVPPGTYSQPIKIKDKAITLKSQDPDDAKIVKATVLNGMQDAPVITLENSDATLEGFTIQNGKGLYGGGVLAKKGSPTIQKNIIKGNKALKSGGGIALIGTTNAKVKGNTIKDNIAFLDGGGVFQLDGIGTDIFQNMFTQNKAVRDGGGFAEKSAKRKLPEGESWAKVKNNSFKKNQAGISGGGLKACVSGFSIDNNFFEGNIAGYTLILITPGYKTPTVTIQFYDQSAGRGGGASLCETSSSLAPGANWILSVDSNTFKGNKASQGGMSLALDTGVPGIGTPHFTLSNNIFPDIPKSKSIVKGTKKGKIVVAAVGCPECQKLWEEAKLAESVYKGFLEDFPHLEKDIQDLTQKKDALKKEMAPLEKEMAKLEKKIAKIVKAYFKIKDEITFNKNFAYSQYKKGKITIWNAGYFNDLDKKNAELEKKIYPLMKKKGVLDEKLRKIRAKFSPKEDELWNLEQTISSTKHMIKVLKRSKRDWEVALAKAKSCQQKCEEKQQLENLIKDLTPPKKKRRKVKLKIIQIIPHEGNNPFDPIDPLEGESTTATTGTTYKGIACGFDTITVISQDATSAVVSLKDNPNITFSFGAPSLFAGPPHPTIPAQVYEAQNVTVNAANPSNLTMDLQIGADTVVMWAGDTTTGWLGCSGEFAK